MKDEAGPLARTGLACIQTTISNRAEGTLRRKPA
jgi:hypothetical protein